MDAAFIQARIDATKLQIVAYEDATLALAQDGIQSYKLDTGQSIQNVTKLDLTALNKTIMESAPICWEPDKYAAIVK